MYNIIITRKGLLTDLIGRWYRSRITRCDPTFFCCNFRNQYYCCHCERVASTGNLATVGLLICGQSWIECQCFPSNRDYTVRLYIHASHIIDVQYEEQNHTVEIAVKYCTGEQNVNDVITHGNVDDYGMIGLNFRHPIDLRRRLYDTGSLALLRAYPMCDQ